MLTDQEIQAIVSQEIFNARGFDSDELGGNREQALNYYLGKHRGDEVEGRSEVQSLDVSDHVNATMAQLSPMMKATLVAFKPTGPDDEDAAQAESDVVKQIAEDSGAFVQFSDGAFDALLQKNGWIKVYVEDDVQIWEDEYTDQDPAAIGDIITPVSQNDVVEITKQSDVKDSENINFTVQHTTTTRELRIESVAPEFMIFAEGHKKQDISDIRFVGERMLSTRSELLESGLDKALVESLPTVGYDTWAQSETRVIKGDSEHVGGQEPSTKVVEMYDAHIWIDVDEDGIAELWRVRVAGYDAAIFLDKQRAKFIPYCTGTARPMPHRVSGTSLFDLLQFIQDSKTITLRQLLDNQNTGNNVRVGAVEGEVNMNDLLESKPGGVIRMRSPDAVQPIPFNDVGPTCINTLNYLDTVATARAGAAKDMAEGEFQIAGTSAAAAVGEIGHKEMMSAFFARNIIETLVASSYKLIHQALRCYYSEPVDVLINGEWIQSDPSRWKPRQNLRVIAGLSGTERREKAKALTQTLSYQVNAMQAGLEGVLVSPTGIHNTLADWVRMADLDEVSSYFIDPASKQAQQAGKKKIGEKQQKELKAQQLQSALTEAPLKLDKYKADQEDKYKRWSDTLDAQVEEMKITGKGIADLELQGLKGSQEAIEEAAEARQGAA